MIGTVGASLGSSYSFLIRIELGIPGFTTRYSILKAKSVISEIKLFPLVF